MAIGLKILRAISEKRRGWPPNAEFKICAVDALSLLTLSRRDLLREKFRDIVAEEERLQARLGVHTETRFMQTQVVYYFATHDL